MRLFVDCDDTLLLFGYPDADPDSATPYGFWRDVPYTINQPLVAFMRAFREKHEDALIVIWSGGGEQYAYAVMRAVGLGEDDPEFIDPIPMIKDRTTFPLVGEDDIVVDDQPIKVAATVAPPDFFDNKDNWGL